MLVPLLMAMLTAGGWLDWGPSPLSLALVYMATNQVGLALSFTPGEVAASTAGVVDVLQDACNPKTHGAVSVPITGTHGGTAILQETLMVLMPEALLN